MKILILAFLTITALPSLLASEDGFNDANGRNGRCRSSGHRFCTRTRTRTHHPSRPTRTHPSSSSSACPTAYKPCAPTIMMDFVTRNGCFDQPTRIPVRATRTAVPGWAPTRLTNATIDYVGVPNSLHNINSNGAGRIRLKAQPPGSFQAYGALAQKLTYCHHKNYTVSFAAYQNDTVSQSCRLAFFTSHEGTILEFDNILTSTWTEYGPYYWHDYQTFRDNLCEQNDDGSFTDELQILVQCQGIEGRKPQDVEVMIDSIFILPVYGLG